MAFLLWTLCQIVTKMEQIFFTKTTSNQKDASSRAPGTSVEGQKLISALRTKIVQRSRELDSSVTVDIVFTVK